MQFFFKIKQFDDFTIDIKNFTYWLNTKTSEWLYTIIDDQILCIFNSDNYNRADLVTYSIKKNFFNNNQYNFKNIFLIHSVKDEIDLGRYLIKYFINKNVLNTIDITIFQLFNISGYSKTKLLTIITTTNSIINKSLICSYCSKKFSTATAKTTHENKNCPNKNNYNIEIKLNNLENENKKLKEKLKKNKQTNIQPIINITQNNNNAPNIIQNNIINNNNINLITKKDKLNHFYKDTIDMDTFIEKYKYDEKYKITFEESEALLYVLESNGYLQYSDGVYYCLKNKCSMIFNDINTNNEKKNINQNILPFIMSDSQFRTHYEKNNQQWNISKNNEKIKHLITETNNQVYNHHNKSPILTSSEIIKVSNNILRKTDMSNLELENKNEIKNQIENEKQNEIENEKQNQIENENVLDLELD